MTRGAWALAFVLASASAARAQPSQVVVSAATQIFTGDSFRIGSLKRVEPDLGLSWLKPNVVGGTLGIDMNLTRRDEKLRLGRGLVSLKDAKAAGLTWDLTAGDTGTPPFVPDFGFSNLQSPALTFAGASVAGRTKRVSLRAAGGRTSQTRNIFGTDFTELRQSLFQADVSVQASQRVQVTARGSRVQNGDLEPYPTFVDWADDIGGGVRLKPTAFWQIVADAGMSWFRRRGAVETESSPSWLVGSMLTGQRGRLEINAQRFSVGRFAAVNYPYNDRQGVFTSGELQLAKAFRVFGGADVSSTNLDPSASQQASVAMPDGVQTRGFGGVRLQWARHSTFTFRAEGGGREVNPSRFTPGYESDTGSLTAEWHGNLPRTTVYTRYERRTNVDANYAPSSFRQHEMSGQIFVRLDGGREVFAQGMMFRRADRVGGGETEWYAGGGAQLPIAPMNVRVEGTFGRTRDWETGRTANRQMIVGGVSGQIAKNTFLSADIVVNHASIDAPGSHPWFTRSMIRVTRTLSYGTALQPAANGDLPVTGPTGSLDSVVFIDWNGNGERDADEEAAQGVGVMIARMGTTATGRDGRAAFGRVPVGERLVSLDLSTVPADYDLPAESTRLVGVERGKRASLGFGLVPVGTVTGAVFADTDGSGTLSDADQPVYDAVVTIDEAARSELAREGRFRFDNVRLGRHVVVLEMDSLEEGAQLVGLPQLDVDLTRETRTASVTYLVRLEKRPEVRKVFPPRKVRVPDLRGAAEGGEPEEQSGVQSTTPAPPAPARAKKPVAKKRKPARKARLTAGATVSTARTATARPPR